jgi:hypothetical protein
MDLPDPIQDAQDRFATMRAGVFDRITPEDAEAGLGEAQTWLQGGIGGRRLGSGLIKAMPLYEGGDWLPVWVAIADGDRAGAIMVTLSGSATAAASNSGENPSAVALEHLRGMSILGEHSHFDQVALAHPINF